MRKSIFLILVCMILASCSSVPLTGRKRLMLVSDTEILSASLSEYQTYMKTATRSNVQDKTQMVTRVGQKVATATEKYLRENGMESEIEKLSWEFNLVKDDQLNAFCLPGGKIVVYEGIMSLVSNDDELAVIIGHEVAHAIAKHSNERMSQQVMAQYGAMALGVALSNKDAVVQNVAQGVFGLGAQYGVMLPFSRKHELEADHIGLVLMTMAGYEPEYSITFWKKMAASTSQSTSEFTSTHPSNEKRIKQLEKLLSDVKQEYGK